MEKQRLRYRLKYKRKGWGSSISITVLPAYSVADAKQMLVSMDKGSKNPIVRSSITATKV
jgi:hypothetical protein